MTLETPRTLLAAAAVAVAAVTANPAAASIPNADKWVGAQIETLGDKLTKQNEQTLSVSTFKRFFQDRITSELDELLRDRLGLGPKTPAA